VWTKPSSEDSDYEHREWQWYADAIEMVNAQLAAISESWDYAVVI